MKKKIEKAITSHGSKHSEERKSRKAWAEVDVKDENPLPRESRSFLWEIARKADHGNVYANERSEYYCVWLACHFAKSEKKSRSVTYETRQDSADPSKGCQRPIDVSKQIANNPAQDLWEGRRKRSHFKTQCERKAPQLEPNTDAESRHPEKDLTRRQQGATVPT